MLESGREGCQMNGGNVGICKKLQFSQSSRKKLE